MQTRLKPLQIERERKDYPQVNSIKDGVQYIELNRGCKRQCKFCYADPNYKVFNIPIIEMLNKYNKSDNILDTDILIEPKKLKGIFDFINQKMFDDFEENVCPIPINQRNLSNRFWSRWLDFKKRHIANGNLITKPSSLKEIKNKEKEKKCFNKECYRFDYRNTENITCYYFNTYNGYKNKI